MGRLIDIENIDYVRLEDSLHCLEHHKGDEVECVICAPTIEAIPKDEYETRLKADMVAMLEDLKQDIIAEAYGIETDCSDYVVNVADIDMVIQQKINELKGEGEK